VRAGHALGDLLCREAVRRGDQCVVGLVDRFGDVDDPTPGDPQAALSKVFTNDERRRIDRLSAR
jgi:hypothetical protein